MFEIEIKAWLDNPSETERIVSTFAEYAGASFKSDCYWYNEQQKIEVRVREEKFVSKNNKKTSINNLKNIDRDNCKEFEKYVNIALVGK